jgi:hypothetical protein
MSGYTDWELSRNEGPRPYPWKALIYVHPERIAEIEGLTALEHLDGYVWCDEHNEIHHRQVPCMGIGNTHRPLYMEPRDVTDNEDRRNPMPRPNRAPNIDHLLRERMIEALLPLNIYSDVDREALADELLAMAKAQGAKLRRERILKNLRRVSVEMSNWDYSINPPFGDWALQIDEGTALIEELSA